MKKSIVVGMAIFMTIFARSELAKMANVGMNPIGLVLSGGGTKGAYEVGVWQELVECGLAKQVTAIPGTSVGAINAVLLRLALTGPRHYGLKTRKTCLR